MKNKTKLIPLTINRKKWARGGYNGESALLNDEGNMCCLGFACRASGVSARVIQGHGTPEDMACEVAQPRRLGKKLAHMVTVKKDPIDGEVQLNNTPPIQDAIDANDDNVISDKMREYKLKPILKKLGFAAKFVGPARTED